MNNTSFGFLSIKKFIIMKYKILMESNPVKLQAEVNRFVKAGWKPQGGLVVSTQSPILTTSKTRVGEHTVFAQAMTHQ